MEQLPQSEEPKSNESSLAFMKQPEERAAKELSTAEKMHAAFAFGELVDALLQRFKPYVEHDGDYAHLLLWVPASGPRQPRLEVKIMSEEQAPNDPHKKHHAVTEKFVSILTHGLTNQPRDTHQYSRRSDEAVHRRDTSSRPVRLHFEEGVDIATVLAAVKAFHENEQKNIKLEEETGQNSLPVDCEEVAGLAQLLAQARP